jgi:hypothetical protein
MFMFSCLCFISFWFLFELLYVFAMCFGSTVFLDYEKD